MLLLKKKSLHGYQHWLVPDIFESSFSQLNACQRVSEVLTNEGTESFTQLLIVAS